MSPAEIKAVVRRYIEEVWNNGNLDVADEVLANPYRAKLLIQGAVQGGDGEESPDVIKEAYKSLRASFPDGHLTIEEMIVEDDRVFMRFTFRGTHLGEFAGLAPTGRKLEYAGVNIHRVVDGKIVEYADLTDRLGMWQQLGVLPPTREFLNAARQKQENGSSQ